VCVASIIQYTDLRKIIPKTYISHCHGIHENQQIILYQTN